MKRLRDELAQTDFSRGAIYRAQQWFEGMTEWPEAGPKPWSSGASKWRAPWRGSSSGNKVPGIWRKRSFGSWWKPSGPTSDRSGSRR